VGSNPIWNSDFFSEFPLSTHRSIFTNYIIHKIDALAGYIPSFLGKNIKVVDWLPQNDLLAHKDIKAFVSHVGHNSLYETAYHGVPVVAYPLFAEQDANAKKAERFGFGLAVNHRSTNAQQLLETIELVISEPR